MDAVHQRRWSRLNDFKKLFGILRTKNKSPGSDYTGTVTKVEGSTAYVQLTGSDITDTPVALSIDAKPGDRVRVRVSNGRAWITGNDTLPPSNDKKEVAQKMSKDMSNRSKHIVIRDGVIKFIGDTLVVESKNFQLDEVGNATFSGTLNAAGGTFDGTMQFINSNRGTDDVVEIGPDAGASIIITNDSTTLGHAEASIGARYIEIQETDEGTGDANAFISGSSISVTQPDVGTSGSLQSGKLTFASGTKSCYYDVSGIHPSSTSSGSLTTTLTGGSNYRNNVTNRAGIVNVDFHRANFTAWNMSGPFATIPTGFRPSVVEYIPGAIFANGSWIPTYFSISTNGSVSVGYNPAGSGSTCTHLWFCGTFSI